MLFNSFEYWVFLPIVFLLYWFVFCKTASHQNLLLLAASYFFYGWWSWKFLVLLAVSTLLDFGYGFGVASAIKNRSRFFLWMSIINNLGILAVFKYYDFFITQFQHGLRILDVHISPSLIQVALPIGISFYTFHGMSYVFDIYRGLRKPVANLADYALFVSFFPLLISGPIERANHLLPQVQAKRSFSYTQAVDGGRLILWGMFKKVVIADSLALYVNEIFDRYPSHHSLTLILGAVGFSFQIYADFSGYTDIATGTAKLFGFELLSNFKFPYFSRNLAEFWRRWHISLTTWFRDYLYIPMGGSKQGKRLAVRNTFIVFLISGFWHGASWNFIVWGGIHACGFMPLLLSSRNRKHTGKIVAADRLLPSARELLQMLGTFTFVTISWIFFRLHGVRSGVDYVKGIFSSFDDPGEALRFLGILYYVIPLILIDWWLRRDERKIRWVSSPAIGWTIYIIVLTIIFAYMGNAQAYRFIYFQF